MPQGKILTSIKKARESIESKLGTLTNDVGMKIGLLGTTLSNQLKAHTDKYTAARAEKLDNLDKAISSRADASYYSPGRASKLDNLDKAISSRADASYYSPARASKLDNLDRTISSRADGAHYTPARAEKIGKIPVPNTEFIIVNSIADGVEHELINITGHGTVSILSGLWSSPSKGVTVLIDGTTMHFNPERGDIIVFSNSFVLKHKLGTGYAATTYQVLANIYGNDSVWRSST